MIAAIALSSARLGSCAQPRTRRKVPRDGSPLDNGASRALPLGSGPGPVDFDGGAILQAALRRSRRRVSTLAPTSNLDNRRSANGWPRSRRGQRLNDHGSIPRVRTGLTAGVNPGLRDRNSHTLCFSSARPLDVLDFLKIAIRVDLPLGVSSQHSLAGRLLAEQRSNLVKGGCR